MNCPGCGSTDTSIGRPVVFPQRDCRERRCKCGCRWSTTERIDAGTVRRVETPKMARVESIKTDPVETLKTRSVSVLGEKEGVSDPSPMSPPILEASGSGSPARKGRPDAEEYPEDFERLWKETGRHGNKHPAFKLWLAIKNTVDLNTLIDRWREWEKTSQWQAGYVPHLRKWLYSRGWQDSPPEHEFRGRLVAGGKTSNNENVALDFMRKRGIL